MHICKIALLHPIVGHVIILDDPFGLQLFAVIPGRLLGGKMGHPDLIPFLLAADRFRPVGIHPTILELLNVLLGIFRVQIGCHLQGKGIRNHDGLRRRRRLFTGRGFSHRQMSDGVDHQSRDGQRQAG